MNPQDKPKPASKPKPAPKSDPIAEHVAKHSEQIAALEGELEKMKKAVANALGIAID